MMKKYFLTMIALISMTAAMAQQSDNNRERKAPQPPTAEQMTDRMAQTLNLNDDQKARLLKLNTEYKDVLRGPGRMGRGQRGPRPDGTTGASQQQSQQRERPNRPELTEEQKKEMAARMEKRQKYDEEVKKILTEEQYKSWKKQHQRRPGLRGGGHKGKRGQTPDVN
jgi:Spy/CpxP family protein refolding chaperone